MNGNLKADFSKGIVDIQYNSLNLQKSVLLENDNRIDYLYDANGIKRNVSYNSEQSTENNSAGRSFEGIAVKGTLTQTPTTGEHSLKLNASGSLSENKLNMDMKTKNINAFCLIAILFFIVGCRGKKQQSDCDMKAENIVRLIDNYESTNNKSVLDSVMICIDELVEECPKWAANMLLRKALLYDDLHEYEKAISTIILLDSTDFHPFFSKSIIVNKLKAKEALQNEDSVLYFKFLEKVVNEYAFLIETNKKEIDSVLVLSDYNQVTSNEWPALLEMYYYYKSKQIGKDKVITEISKLEESTNGNRDYFNKLKEEIINENSFSLFD